MEKHHPFWKKNALFQYTYCFGLGVMSMGHMKSIMETQDFFEDILRAIRLPESKWQQIFFDLNNHFEEWIDKVFALLRGKEEQYCFTLDLYRIRSHTVSNSLRPPLLLLYPSMYYSLSHYFFS